MNTYKHAVRDRIQVLLDTGLTQKEVAERLEYDNPNNVSMLMSDNHPTTILAPAKLRLLQKACHLTNCEALALFRRLSASGRGESKSMHLDLPTCDWLIRTTVLAKSEVDARRRKAASSEKALAGAGHA